ncbi:MAG: hypothetical protein QOD66_1637 [Solirubrobacteraceae bacterium]|jgi:endonuclease/exonuclease/phosphatase family metal-dependent hydrolase|nr:hypothetical protein [Solirubrobacteraceae bacterium]
MRWSLPVLLLVAVAAGALAAAAGSHARSASTSRVTVMTRNLFLGTNLLPLATAAPGAPFEHAVSAALANVRATGPTARMKLIAREIAGAKPDLVGLQEVSIWSTGPVGGPPSHVVVDYLKVIQGELRRLHAPYRVVARRLSLKLRGVSSAGVEVGLTDGNVILARSGVRISHAHSGDFSHQLKITTKALGSVTVTRSWNALDATVRGADLHFVNAHLEAYSTSVRLQQARELVADPLRSRRPTILVGDLNSGPHLPIPADRPPFEAISAAGFVDARTARPNCCFNDDLHTGRWDHIVDHIMTKPKLRLVRSGLTGRETTSAGRHPSDHGGVVSEFAL